MSKKTVVYNEAPKYIARTLDESEIIEDFLPPPEKLIFKKSRVKVTMLMNSNSIEVFKRYAQKHNIKYQTIINEVVDRYAQRYQDALMA